MTAAHREPARALAAVALAVLIAGAARGADPFVVPALPLPGPHPVACSNVAQDFSRLAPGEDAALYWEGVPRESGAPRTPFALLSDPANTLSVTVTAPDNGSVYGTHAGTNLRYVVIVCHPTASADPRPDHALPTGRAVPHMQSGGEAPLWPDAASRFPLLIFSHGYGSSPLSTDHLDAMTTFASYGYIVAAPFHTDEAFSDLRIENLGDLLDVILSFTDFVAMQALRPLALSAMTDMLLGHPHWRDRIDPAQIGGFGASMGAESLLLLAGAGLTTSIGQSWTVVARDPRLRAVASYIPYFGQPGYPAFGRGQRGLDGVHVSFLAVSGTNDLLAPLAQALEGVARLAGPRELVALAGTEHRYDATAADDIYTWTITYLDAELRGDPAARARLARMTGVAGGRDDRVLIPFNGPGSGSADASNFGGLWWNAPTGSEPGWALYVSHQGDVIFATWATYDLDGRPWWLSMTAERVGASTYSGVLYQTRGPGYAAPTYDASQVAAVPLGTGTLTFSGADTGVFDYSLHSTFRTKTITRGIFASPVPSCAFGTSIDPASATNYQDIWANAPAGSEPGWALVLAHQGPFIFAIWLTYDADGSPLWLSATLIPKGSRSFAGVLYRTSGPPFNSVPFDAASVRLVPVGTASIDYTDGNSGTFSYVIDGVSRAKPITRYVFRPPGTLCR